MRGERERPLRVGRRRGGDLDQQLVSARPGGAPARTEGPSALLSVLKGLEIQKTLGSEPVLAVRGLTLDTSDPGVLQSPLEGLNFVWAPNFDGLGNPSTWLAAAGQIFFTLSVGMGSIHCYASYLREQEDIALNAASAGWMNEFVEVILGGSVLIPIAAGVLYPVAGILLSPVLAGAAMAGSSVSVVTNSLRLRRFRPRSLWPTTTRRTIEC